MTRNEFEEIINKLENCITAYERSYISDTKTILYLANGEKLTVRIPRSTIPHLLGINIDNIRITNILPKNLNAYDLLNTFIEESYSFSKLICVEQTLPKEKIFSKHIEEKLDSFWENIHIKNNDVIAVVKFDKEKRYKSEEVCDVSNYYIIRKKDQNYFILGLIKNEEKGYAYVPSTIRKYDNFFEFEEYMRTISYKQDLTYINNIQIDNDITDYHNNFPLKIDTKTEKIDYLIKLGKKYSATPAVANDLLFNLRKYQIQYQGNNINKEIISLLTDAILNETVLNLEEIELSTISEEITSLIKTYNDSIVKNAIEKNQPEEKTTRTEPLESYSKIKEENYSLKEQLKKLKEELLNIQQTNTLLENEVSTLKEREQINEESINIYKEAHNKVMKLRKESN